MASRVEFAVAVTPIYTHAAGEGAGVDVIATDVGKSLSGSGSTTVTWGTTGGYSGGSPVYVTSNNTAIAVTNCKFLYIKNTGFKYSSSSALGDAVSDYVKVYVAGEVIASLAAGAAMIIPFDAAITQTYTLVSNSNHMAVEYFWTA